MPINYDNRADNDKDALLRSFDALLLKLDKSSRMTNSQDPDSRSFKKIVDALHALKATFEDTYEALENAGDKGNANDQM